MRILSLFDGMSCGRMNAGFSWSEIDPDWQNWSMLEYRAALSHPAAERGFGSDFGAMQWADACVLVCPCGRSAHTEAGWMTGAGKPVWVYIPEQQEPELMYKVYDRIVTDITELDALNDEPGR
ncbi:hypothetical protein [Rikenella microfusus]|uniref:Uncharacterized protein n=1 Tax=Rikenella microfusus TaxID=28139 RepID=A0A379MPS4_9BACT|nr:hypothetical protein [Rikenella microfusus]SUE33651.1 Uncharacterised protein [Rikenella microfusus]